MAFSPKYTITAKINKAFVGDRAGMVYLRPTDKPEFSVEFSGKIGTMKKLKTDRISLNGSAAGNVSRFPVTQPDNDSRFQQRYPSTVYGQP